MKKTFLLVMGAFMLMPLLFTSCQKEADYVVGVGDSFEIRLLDESYLGRSWYCIDEDNLDIVSMQRIAIPETTNIQPSDNDTLHPVGVGESQVALVFTGVKKGYAIVHLADSHGTEANKLSFSVRVE